MSVHVRLHNVGVEVLREVEDVMGNAELLSHSPCVVNVADRAATRVLGATPELHRRTNHLVTLLKEERGGDR
jgi:hypothetical protein